jgi:hypothetical protein
MTERRPAHDPDEHAAITPDARAAPPASLHVDPADDAVDEMERESFPASDPHSGWAGPPDS